MSTPAIGAGTVLGSARIEHFIGEGNVGTVWKAHHVGLGIDVAIKVLKPAPEGERQRFRERFQREARLIAKLNHPGIVRVLDCGEFHGTLYLVMEYVDGFTLEDFLRRRPGAVSETTGRKIIQATAMALSIAHEEGIIHRDLKPANLLIDKKGRLKIADFGLARERGGATLTMEKVAVGSPAYMSPEALQPDHGEPDQRSDLYALGIIAYQLAFGRLPYNGTMSQIVHGHLGGTARFDLPCEWSSQSIDMIRHLMEHDRTHRTATAKAVIEACLAISNGSTARTQRVARGTGTGSRAAAGSGELSGMVAFLEGALGENSSKVGGKTIVHTTARERLVVWGVLVGVLVLAIAGFVVFAPKRIGSEPGAVPPAPRSATSATSPSSP